MSTIQIQPAESIERLCVLAALLRRAQTLLDEHIELHPGLTESDVDDSCVARSRIYGALRFVTEQQIKQQIATKQPAKHCPDSL